MLPCGSEVVQRICAVQSGSTGLFAQFAAVFVSCQWQVQVLRGGVTQQSLQCDLSGRVVEQISASDNMGDALSCIIGDNGQLVGVKRSASSDNKIPDTVADIFCHVAVHQIFLSLIHI